MKDRLGMGTLSKVIREDIPEDSEKQYIKVFKSKKRISTRIVVCSFIDSDTKQYIVYCPALKISGYGATKNKADKMFDFSIDQFFEYLIEFSPDRINTELRKLGWKQDKIKNKEYSSAFVGVDGELKNFNVKKGSLRLQAVIAD